MWATTTGLGLIGLQDDYQKLKIKVDTRGLAKLMGTLHFSDLEKLPRVSHVFLLQCGAANPRGVVKWTGVRFTDFADMLGLVPGAHYCRLVGSDRRYVDEPMATLRHPQVMLAWMMNDAPLLPSTAPQPARRSVSLRNRSIKAITEIMFATPGLPCRRCRHERKSRGSSAKLHIHRRYRACVGGSRRRRARAGQGPSAVECSVSALQAKAPAGTKIRLPRLSHRMARTRSSAR
jgi:DMSO/TMAO reductase YedYZ molybdopterin-dependent catalytic subunit